MSQTKASDTATICRVRPPYCWLSRGQDAQSQRASCLFDFLTVPAIAARDSGTHSTPFLWGNQCLQSVRLRYRVLILFSVRSCTVRLATTRQAQKYPLPVLCGGGELQADGRADWRRPVYVPRMRTSGFAFPAAVSVHLRQV